MQSYYNGIVTRYLSVTGTPVTRSHSSKPTVGVLPSGNTSEWQQNARKTLSRLGERNDFPNALARLGRMRQYLAASD